MRDDMASESAKPLQFRLETGQNTAWHASSAAGNPAFILSAFPVDTYICSLVGRASRTDTPPTQVRFPVRQGIFLPESTFSADSLTVFAHSRAKSHVFTSVRTLKIP